VAALPERFLFDQPLGGNGRQNVEYPALPFDFYL
jgi:hypothetical protein